MVRPTMPREALVAKLATVFREHGYDGASLTRLSEATGLVKASLYYQFPNGKKDMAAAVLDATSAQIGADVIGPLSASGPIRARLARMCAGLDDVYSGGRSFCVVDVFGIGEAGRLFRRHLRGAVAAITAAIRDALTKAGLPADEAGRRAEDAIIAVQGSLVIARATNDPTPFRRVLAELPDRLLAGMPG